jgi:plasmid stability protein
MPEKNRVIALSVPVETTASGHHCPSLTTVPRHLAKSVTRRMGLNAEAEEDISHAVWLDQRSRLARLDLPARSAYNAGMQYTLRNVPPELDRALREKARREGRSLNDVAIEALRRMMEVGPGAVRQRDLADIVGTLQEDPALDADLSAQRQIDSDVWK